ESDGAVGRVAERDDCALEGAEPGQGGERGVDLVERAQLGDVDASRGERAGPPLAACARPTACARVRRVPAKGHGDRVRKHLEHAPPESVIAYVRAVSGASGSRKAVEPGAHPVVERIARVLGGGSHVETETAPQQLALARAHRRCRAPRWRRVDGYDVG